MKRPFDPILKTLAELSPADWLPFAGRRRRRITVEDSDIGTIVSGATDKLFRVHDNPEYLLHLDFESGHFHSELPLRLRLYNSLFEYRHQRVVLSVPVLLSPAADSPQWNGLLERGLPGEEPVSTLRYQVVRVWQLPVEQVLRGGIGTLALAPITNVAPGDVRHVIGRMKERLSGTSPPRHAADVWAAAYVLLGLRYNPELTRAIFEEVLAMKESSTYQAIAEEERAIEARRMLLLQGEAKFGPNAAAQAQIEAIADLARLEKLGVRMLNVGTWEELLARPASRKRNGRKSRS